MKRLWVKVLLCVLAVEILGAAGGIVTSTSVKDWYPSLEKPPGTPPNWVFAPVWTTLFALMGIALARVWHSDQSNPLRRSAFVWFAVQMVLNVAWTPVFFGLHWLGVALVVIVALWIAIALTIRAFFQVDRLAAWMLIPYLAWVSYATYLNAGNWWLNR